VKSVSNVRINNLVKLAVMLELAKGPAHGYGLMNSVETLIGKKPGAAQMYPFLRLLEGKGLAKAGESGVREKTEYELTLKGKRFVNGLLPRFGGLVDIAVEPKLTVCAHCGCKLFSGGHAETVRGRKLVFCCSHCAASFKKCG